MEEASHGERADTDGVADYGRQEVKGEEKRALGSAKVFLVRERDADELGIHDRISAGPPVLAEHLLTADKNASEFTAVMLANWKLSSVPSTRSASVVATQATAVSILIPYVVLVSMEDSTRDWIRCGRFRSHESRRTPKLMRRADGRRERMLGARTCQLVTQMTVRRFILRLERDREVKRATARDGALRRDVDSVSRDSERRDSERRTYERQIVDAL